MRWLGGEPSAPRTARQKAKQPNDRDPQTSALAKEATHGVFLSPEDCDGRRFKLRASRPIVPRSRGLAHQTTALSMYVQASNLGLEYPMGVTRKTWREVGGGQVVRTRSSAGPDAQPLWQRLDFD